MSVCVGMNVSLCVGMGHGVSLCACMCVFLCISNEYRYKASPYILTYHVYVILLVHMCIYAFIICVIYFKYGVRMYTYIIHWYICTYDIIVC